MRFFRRKNQYLIQWERNCYVPNEKLETVISAKCEADAVWKFLQGHNAKIEKIDILNVKLVQPTPESVVKLW